MNPVLMHPGKLIRVLKYQLTTGSGSVLNVCDFLKVIPGISGLNQLANYDIAVFFVVDTVNDSAIANSLTVALSDATNSKVGYQFSEAFGSPNMQPAIFPLGAKYRYLNVDFENWGALEDHDCIIEIFIFQVDDLNSNVPPGKAN